MYRRNGKVFKAFNQHTLECVAIKILENGPNLELQNQLALAKHYTSSNLVSCYDVFDNDTEIWVRSLLDYLGVDCFGVLSRWISRLSEGKKTIW